MSEVIPLPLGFGAAGVHCGIKGDADRNDLALFVSDVPCAAAGVFTRNRVCGAPVVVSRERVPRTTARAVIINSGNANACTGERGLDDARWMTAEVARLLECPTEDVLVCSTGVIGHFLPREKLADGIPQVVENLASTPEGLLAAARGMMTTDTVPKLACRENEFEGKTVRVCGAAKGAAMIGPNMGTMLAVIMTDAALPAVKHEKPVEGPSADGMLRHAVDRSFNCISVEGHTSTSDTVFLLANGAAETGELSDDDLRTLQEMIEEVAIELAQAIVKDAEGAEHFVTIDVRGARTRDDAFRIAKTVADSPLVKTAIAGADPNWGRIVSAVGYSGVDVAEGEITLRLNGTTIYAEGAPVEYDERAASERMRSNRDVHIELELPFGGAGVRFWTSDLTAEYVRLNSEYTT